jgi:sugar lactone lactonase YvrE
MLKDAMMGMANIKDSTLNFGNAAQPESSSFNNSRCSMFDRIQRIASLARPYMKNRLIIFLFAAAGLTSQLAAQPTVDFILTNRLAEPHSVAVDENNKFYITDSADHRVFKYDPDNGSLSSLAGVSGQFGAVNGPGFVSRFFSPKGIVMARGGLVVADSGNHMLRFLSLTGSVSIVTNFAGAPGVAGFVDGPVATARFNSPIGLATDPAGNIYVADSKNNAIRKIDPNNIVSTLATSFSEPAAVAVGSGGEIYVADTRNHSIKLIKSDGTVSLLAGKGATSTGTNDSFFAEEALFSSPGGLLWLGGSTGLLVSDSGNHTLRRVFFDPIVAFFFPERNGYSVETYAGIPRQPGFQDGSLTTAKFNSPAGLARDFDNGLLIADLGNAALRRIQTTPRLPKVSSPRIGFVTFIIDEKTGALISQLSPFTEAVFNNDIIIAILAENRTETFYTSGATPGLFEPDTIPIPNSINSQPAPPYADGLPPSEVKPSILEPRPDVTVKALSSAEGRRPSDVVQARIQFKVSTPTIQGDNPASFLLRNETVGADTWYTLDGSAPTNQAPSIQAVEDNISLRITNAVTFRARAFKRNYKPSEISTKTFFPADFQANRITFGFDRGEGSSQFFGSAGQTFIAPVTLSLLPNQRMYSLQFTMTVTNRDNAPALTPGAFDFQSMLLEPLSQPIRGFFVDRQIKPQIFERYDIEIITNNVPQGILITTNYMPQFRDLVFTNLSQNLLGVGWFELVGQTNLYNTTAQDLISISHAHDKRFLSSNGKVVLGGYSFQVPPLAASGSTYRIELGRPSSSDAFSRDVFIDTPTNGSIAAGAINAIKDIRVVPGGIGEGQLRYVVGDVNPFRWFNAGDFGDTNILNNDITQVFQAATYLFNVPPPGTDFFDAMDSCCGGSFVTNVFDGSVTDIDQITLGDGVLNVTDIFVTFRRSLDPSLKWFARYWANGQRAAAEVPNKFRGLNGIPGGSSQSLANLPAETLLPMASAQKPAVTFRAGDFAIASGQTIDVPIRADVAGNYPVRVLLLNLSVEPLEGSPPLTEPLQFTAVPQIGNPILTTSTGPGNYAAAWLDHQVPGFRGAATVGNVRITIPSHASANAAYRIHFDHASASPNGFSVLPLQVEDGLLLVRERSASSFGDGIPDTWRLRYFGSAANQLTQAAADADGDGISNWAEFKAGTNPADVSSQLRLAAASPSTGAGGTPKGLKLRWPSAANRVYSLEAAASISGAEWTAIAATLNGTGDEMEFTVENPPANAQFYRVRLVE